MKRFAFRPIFDWRNERPNIAPNRPPNIDRDGGTDRRVTSSPLITGPIVNQLTDVVSEGVESGCSWRDNGRREEEGQVSSGLESSSSSANYCEKKERES